MTSIESRMIIELLGRPAEHVTSALTMLLDKLGTEKGVSVTKKTIRDPIPVEGSKDLFTTFAEVEISCDGLGTLLGIIFAYLPSNIEITEPQSLKMSNSDLSSLTNTLISRLHTYDAIAKKMITEKDALIRRLKSGPLPTAPTETPAVKEAIKDEEKPTKKKKKSKA